MLDRDRIERLLRVYVLESDNPDLRAYWGGDAIDVDGLVRETDRVVRMGHMRRGRVLDIGCGFGWGAALLAAVGENSVVANDIRETMTRVVEERVEAARRAGFDLPITTLLGDICTLDLPEASFDSVHCAEAIEHVHDLPRMFRVVHRLLRPGGRGVFLNDSNALNPATWDHTLTMWERRDASQDYIDELKRERPIENAAIEPYAVTRRRLIEQSRPDLDGGTVATLVRATAGLTAEEIRGLSRDYRPGRPLPEPPRLSWCRDPLSAEYCERLLDPFEVAAMARGAGLRARVWHRHFNRFPLTALNLVNGLPVPWINRLAFRLRPHFAVVVQRPPAA